MNIEYKKTTQCPRCKNKITLDTLGNHREPHIQCDNGTCATIFNNPYYSGENNNVKE